MKDHSGFYDWLRGMAIINIVAGVLFLLFIFWSGILVPLQPPPIYYPYTVSYPVEQIIFICTAFLVVLSSFGFSVCDLMCRLKAVGVFAIIKAVGLVGLGLFLHNPLILILAIGYCICGIYALKCHREEKNFNKSITAQ